jgi:hypothetical protein
MTWREGPPSLSSSVRIHNREARRGGRVRGASRESLFFCGASRSAPPFAPPSGGRLRLKGGRAPSDPAGRSNGGRSRQRCRRFKKVPDLLSCHLNPLQRGFLTAARPLLVMFASLGLENT